MKRRRKNSILKMAVIAAIIIVSAMLLLSAKDNVSPNQAHIARYRSSTGSKLIDEAVKKIGG
jgi:hypothetical protein